MSRCLAQRLRECAAGHGGADVEPISTVFEIRFPTWQSVAEFLNEMPSECECVDMEDDGDDFVTVHICIKGTDVVL